MRNKNREKRRVEILIGSPTDINTPTSYGWTPLMVASNRDSLQKVKALLEAGADVDKGDEYNFLPLMCAAVAGRTDVVRLLLEHGAKVDACDKYGHTALSWAITKGDFDDTAKVLIEAGADINKADFGEFTPLMRAALMSHPKGFSLLLAKGADRRPINPSWGKTALEMALERGSEKMKQIARTISSLSVR